MLRGTVGRDDITIGAVVLGNIVNVNLSKLVTEGAIDSGIVELVHLGLGKSSFVHE